MRMRSEALKWSSSFLLGRTQVTDSLDLIIVWFDVYELESQVKQK